MEEQAKNKLPVIDTTGDENDDWMQKSNPGAYRQEREIHEELSRKYEAKAEAEKAGDVRDDTVAGLIELG